MHAIFCDALGIYVPSTIVPPTRMPKLRLAWLRVDGVLPLRPAWLSAAMTRSHSPSAAETRQRHPLARIKPQEPRHVAPDAACGCRTTLGVRGP